MLEKCCIFSGGKSTWTNRENLWRCQERPTLVFLNIYTHGFLISTSRFTRIYTPCQLKLETCCNDGNELNKPCFLQWFEGEQSTFSTYILHSEPYKPYNKLSAIYILVMILAAIFLDRWSSISFICMPYKITFIGLWVIINQVQIYSTAHILTRENLYLIRPWHTQKWNFCVQECLYRLLC